MAYKYEHPLISSMLVQIGNHAVVWNEKVTAVINQADVLATSANMDSEVIGKAKEYLALTYPMIGEMLYMAIGALDGLANLYSSEYIDLDGNYYAVIDQKELTDYAKKLNSYAGDIPVIDDAIKKALDAISDISDIPYAGLLKYTLLLQEKAKKVTELNDNITAIEDNYKSTQTQKLRDMITSLEGMIKKAMSVSNLRDFNPDFYVKSPEFQQAVNSYNQLYDEMTEKQEELTKAYEANSDMFVQLEKDYEERVKAAQTAKIVTGVVAVVASVTVTVATGGAAAPLVMAGVSAATGFVSGSVNSYFDQRIGSVYCPGKVSAGKVFASGVGNAVISFGTSMLGAGAGNLTSKLTEGVTSEVGKAVIKIGVNAGKDVIVGVGKRMISTSIETGSLKEGAKNAFNLKNIVADGLSSAVSGTVGEVCSSFLTVDVSSADSGLKRTGKNVLNGVIKEVPKGASERFTDTLVKEGNLGEAAEKAFDVPSLLGDAVSGATSEVTEDKLKQQRYAKMQKKIDEDTQKWNGREKKSITDQAQDAGFTNAKATKNGNVSYEDDDAMIRGEDDKPAKAQIKAQGDRQDDKETLYNDLRKSGILTENNSRLETTKSGTKNIYVTDPKTGKEQKCTVHYLDDYNVEDGTYTLELVKDEPHARVFGGKSGFKMAEEANEMQEKYNEEKGKLTTSGEIRRESNYAKAYEGAAKLPFDAYNDMKEAEEEKQKVLNEYRTSERTYQQRPRVQFGTGSGQNS